MKRLGVLAALVVVAGCGAAVDGEGPEEAAQQFARAWTEARCDAAMKWVQAPDANWKASCRATYRFGVTCDEVQPGDPPPADCGPGTRIRVSDTEVTSSKDGRVAVLVSYTQGRATRESRTLRLRLADAGGWKVTQVG